MRFTIEKVKSATGDDLRYRVIMPGRQVVECRSPQYDEAVWRDEDGIEWRMLPDARWVYRGDQVFARSRPFASLTNTSYWSVPGIPRLEDLVEKTGCVFLYISEKNGSRIARARQEKGVRTTATVVVKDSYRPLLPITICMAMGLLACRE